MRPASAGPVLAVLAFAFAHGALAHGALAQERRGAGIANPASQHCLRIGGQLQIREGAQGQFGVCILPDGRQCEEWALFRDGRCLRPPA